MEISFSFSLGDHTAGAWREQALGPMSQARLHRILARIAGNAGAATIAVYVNEPGLASLSAQERAENEIWFNDAIAAVADPAPEVNDAGEPVEFTARDMSLYCFYQPALADVATSALVKVWLD